MTQSGHIMFSQMDEVAFGKPAGDGKGADLIKHQGGGSRHPTSAETVANNLDLALRAVHEQSGSSGSKSRWLEVTCGYLEEFFDAGDAVRRRRAANKIYKDLVAERISQERAAMELQKLVVEAADTDTKT